MRRSRKKGLIFVLALAFCALVGLGCANFQAPRIDPTGKSVFVQPPVSTTPQFRETTGSSAAWSGDVAVAISPGESVAPVGSEVVLVAGVVGDDNYLRTNRRLEWSIAPTSAGQFVDVGRSGCVDLMVGDFNRPRIVTNTFAVGSTSRSYLRLTRGTPSQDDDVCVLAGQGWIAVTSPVEGTSYVTVHAPTVERWPCHNRLATIHWVNAGWQFPPPSINAAGSTHTLTTKVMRQTDHEPCEGWLVRYAIADGPPAGFVPDGAASIEVPTDAAGLASAQVFEKEPKPGTNKIAVEVIRPAAKGGPQGKRLVVGSGCTTLTWTSPDLAVRMLAPPAVAAGATVNYRIEVTNPGDVPAKNVVVTDELPKTLAYLDAKPAPDKKGNVLRWAFPQLDPGQTQVIELNCRVVELGSAAHCVNASADGGLKSSACATTTAGAPQIDVQSSGPSQANVGQQVTFAVVVSNRGQTPTPKLLIKDRFDEGLVHAVAKSPIERDLGTIAPGASVRVNVTFTAAKTGRLCHRVEVSSESGIHGRAEGCVAVQAAASGAVPPSQPTPKATPPSQSVPPSRTVPQATAPSPPLPQTAPPSQVVPQPTVPSQPVPRAAPPSQTAPKAAPPSQTAPKAAPPSQAAPPAQAAPQPSPSPAGATRPAQQPIPPGGGPAGTPRQEIPSQATPSAGPARPEPPRPGVAVTKIGPERRNVGQTARFTIDVVNTGNQMLTNLKVVDQYDAALSPDMASEGGSFENNRLVWNIDHLPVGQKTQLEVHCRCLKESARASNRVSVACREQVRGEAEALLEIAPAPGRLNMEASDLMDPVRLGKELTYEVRVWNEGASPESNVVLTATVPSGMTPVPIGTSGPQQIRYAIEGQTVRFDPLPQVLPGEKLSYRIRVNTRRPGTFQLRAELASQSQAKPLVVEESTEVFE